MRFEMFDTDFVSAKQMLKVNFVKGVADTFNSKESMCKGAVFLRSVCLDHPGETIERWFPLGTDDWSADDGPVRHLCVTPRFVALALVTALAVRLAYLLASSAGNVETICARALAK